MPPNTITRYSDNTEIASIQELPVPFNQRTPTDVFCTVITAIFAIAMLAFSILSLNIDNLREMTYPTDSMGRKCTLDNARYNYLYFVNPSDITKRLCLQECPKGGEGNLKCWPTDGIGCDANSNPGFEVNIYASTAQETSLGLFCMPDDEEIKQMVLTNSGTAAKFQFVKAFRAIWIGVGITFVVSILFLLGTFFSPRAVLYASIAIGGLSYFFLCGLLIFVSTQELSAYSYPIITLALVLAIIGIMIFSSIFLHRRELTLAIQYLRKAVLVLKNQLGLLLLIPTFLVCSVGLFALCVFQHLAIWSSSTLKFLPQQVYYNPQSQLASIMQFLNVVQFIWGLCFLKSAYNFLISGCAVTHFLWDSSKFTFGLKAFFRFHWGSVVGSSFMTNFFFIPDLLFDFFRPDEDKSPAAYQKYIQICCLCDRVLGLVREESMAFINITGLPYCNASRVSQKIYFLNEHPIDGSNSQSVGRYFRLSGHSLVAAIGTLFCYFSMAEGKVYLPVLLFSYLLNTFAATYFVCLIADLSEALLMCDLVEMYLNNQNQRPQGELNRGQKTRAKGNGGRDFYESNVNQGYDIVPTHPY